MAPDYAARKKDKIESTITFLHDEFNVTFEQEFT
jgi:hypothetical protein